MAANTGPEELALTERALTEMHDAYHKLDALLSGFPIPYELETAEAKALQRAVGDLVVSHEVTTPEDLRRALGEQLAETAEAFGSARAAYRARGFAWSALRDQANDQLSALLLGRTISATSNTTRGFMVGDQFGHWTGPDNPQYAEGNVLKVEPESATIWVGRPEENVLIRLFDDEHDLEHPMATISVS